MLTECLKGYAVKKCSFNNLDVECGSDCSNISMEWTDLQQRYVTCLEFWEVGFLLKNSIKESHFSISLLSINLKSHALTNYVRLAFLLPSRYTKINLCAFSWKCIHTSSDGKHFTHKNNTNCFLWSFWFAFLLQVPRVTHLHSNA